VTRGFDNDSEWLDPTEAARCLRIPLGTLYRLIHEGKLLAAQDPLRVRRADLAACIDQSRIRPGQLAHLDPNVRRRPLPEEPVPLTAAGMPDRRYRRRRSS